MSLATTLLAACIAVAGSTQSEPQQERPEGQQVQSACGDEFASRMRRLHLVRPDLLPYPLAFEVYC